MLILCAQMESFLTKLAGKFLKVSAIKGANRDFFALQYKKRENQLSGKIIILSVIHAECITLALA